MEKRDFIYRFTDIFLSEAVKETILHENWVGNKDFDPRYEEYVKFFLYMKQKYGFKKLIKEEAINELIAKKDEVVREFNLKMSTLFENELIKRGCSKEIAGKLIPENIFLKMR